MVFAVIGPLPPSLLCASPSARETLPRQAQRIRHKLRVPHLHSPARSLPLSLSISPSPLPLQTTWGQTSSPSDCRPARSRVQPRLSPSQWATRRRECAAAPEPNRTEALKRQRRASHGSHSRAQRPKRRSRWPPDPPSRAETREISSNSPHSLLSFYQRQCLSSQASYPSMSLPSSPPLR
jgi:hypothetical protein